MNLHQDYVIGKLDNKGFDIDRSKAEIYGRLVVDGIITCVRARLGGHNKKKYKTLDNAIVSNIGKCLQFDSKDKFLLYLKCDFSYKDYIKSLKEKGFLRR